MVTARLLLLMLVLVISGGLESFHHGSPVVLRESKWREEADLHRREMLEMLYPPSPHPQLSKITSQRHREHLVASHPVYNFLHTYYRYSVNRLLSFSPGTNVLMEGVTEIDISCSSLGLQMKSLSIFSETNTTGGTLCAKGLGIQIGGSKLGSYCPKFMTTNRSSTMKEIKAIKRNLQILIKSSIQPPTLNCFGLHEWAMLYSGRREGTEKLDLVNRHQTLPLRVPQR